MRGENLAALVNPVNIFFHKRKQKMHSSNFLLLLALIATTVLAAKSCHGDANCNEQYYCSKNKLCTPKYEDFCNANTDCDYPKQMCAQQANAERGTCVENAYLYYYDSKNLKQRFITPENGDDVELEIIEPLSMEEIAKLPKAFTLPDTKDFCGMDHAVYRHDGSAMLYNQTNGCEVGECDTPTKRNTFTTNPNKTLRIQWNVIVDGTFSEEAKTKIATVTGELNYYYASTGFQFRSELAFFNSPYVSYRVGITTCASTTNCVDAVPLITALRGADWQKKGAFQVLTQTPENENTNGAAMFPWYSSHGLVLMNPRVLVAGSTTMPHEMGHAIGLRHTFAGVSEVPSGQCATCYESTASDTAGDFCSDTQPVARNWDCASTTTVTNANSCTTQTSWSSNPYTNLMSYGNCRKSFTTQQIYRMRCWYTKFVNNFTL